MSYEEIHYRSGRRRPINFPSILQRISQPPIPRSRMNQVAAEIEVHFPQEPTITYRPREPAHSPGLPAVCTPFFTATARRSAFAALQTRLRRA